MKPDLCNCAKAKKIEYTAPPQQPHKRGTIFNGAPYRDPEFVNLSAAAYETLQATSPEFEAEIQWFVKIGKSIAFVLDFT